MRKTVELTYFALRLIPKTLDAIEMSAVVSKALGVVDPEMMQTRDASTLWPFQLSEEPMLPGTILRLIIGISLADDALRMIFVQTLLPCFDSPKRGFSLPQPDCACLYAYHYQPQPT